MTRTKGISFKTARGIVANITMASILAKEAGSASTADPSKACTNGRSGEDKYGNGMPSTKDKVCSM